MNPRVNVWALCLVTAVVGGCRAEEAAVQDEHAVITRMYAEYAAEFPEVPAITAEEVMTRRGDFVLVDVRSPEEQAVSIIPGAVSQRAYESNPAAYEEKRIVTYCTIGYRSGLYAEKLRARGIDAANLKGSVLSWAHSGGTFEHEGEETKRVHVYGPDWNLLPDEYEAVW